MRIIERENEWEKNAWFNTSISNPGWKINENYLYVQNTNIHPAGRKKNPVFNEER